jgi:hypothetical protein
MKLGVSSATLADAPLGGRLVYRKAPLIYSECVV